MKSSIASPAQGLRHRCPRDAAKASKLRSGDARIGGHEGKVAVCRALAVKGALLDGSKIRKAIEILGELPGSRDLAFGEPSF